jgi:hypothetical protein
MTSQSTATVIERQEALTPVVMDDAAPPVQTESSSLMRIAIEHGASIDTIERLMGLIEREHRRIAERAFYAALSKAQGEFPPIPKTRSIEGRGNYAALEDVIEKCAPVYAQNQLSASFERQFNCDAETGLIESVSSGLVLRHAGGHVERFPPVSMPVERQLSSDGKRIMNDSQAVGAAMSYADRYSYQGAGMRPCEEDTDANVPRQKSQAPRRKSEANGTSGHVPAAAGASAVAQPVPSPNGAPDAAAGWRRGEVLKVDVTGGTSAKGSWKRFGVQIRDDKRTIWASTFSETIGVEVQRFEGTGEKIWFRAGEDNKGKTQLLEVEAR